MADHIVQVEHAELKISPDLYHRWATHYFKCFLDFEAPNGDFSPVPYFLLCRSIELELKSRHLQRMKIPDVKNQFGHDIRKAYDALDESSKVLDTDVYSLLLQASEKYDVAKKGFEYCSLYDVGTKYESFPDLEALRILAVKFVEGDA